MWLFCVFSGNVLVVCCLFVARCVDILVSFVSSINIIVYLSHIHTFHCQFYQPLPISTYFFTQHRDLGTQSSQLLSLQPELTHFPPRMLIHSVIPAISKLCINAPNLWVYALPLHAELSALLTQDKYVYFAGPYLGTLGSCIYFSFFCSCK